MKIYTSFNRTENFVGVVLLSDKGDIYLKDAYQVQTKDEVNANIIGIGRALSFIKNVKPIYATGTIWTYTDMENNTELKKDYKAEVINNEYSRRFQLERGQEIIAYNGNNLEPDLYYLRIAQNEARFAGMRVNGIRISAKNKGKQV